MIGHWRPRTSDLGQEPSVTDSRKGEQAHSFFGVRFFYVYSWTYKYIQPGKRERLSENRSRPSSRMPFAGPETALAATIDAKAGERSSPTDLRILGGLFLLNRLHVLGDCGQPYFSP